METYYYYYYAAMNVIGFLIMAYDKLMAKLEWKDWNRVPENILYFTAIIGGGIGGIIAMNLFWHKTSPNKSRFYNIYKFWTAIHYILLLVFVLLKSIYVM